MLQVNELTQSFKIIKTKKAHPLLRDALIH